MRIRLHVLTAFALLLTGSVWARDVTVTVDTSVTYQTMEGFGGCMNYYSLPGSYVDPLFYDMVVYDLGASMVRLPMPPEIELANDDDDPDRINWDAIDLEMMAPRMEFLKEFKKRGIKRFMASLWSPPEFMKTNRSQVQGGFLRADMREEFAEHLVIFLKAAKEQHGIEFEAISLQNELLFLEFYKSCVYNPAQIREALRAVARRFRREGITTRIMFPEDLMWQERMIWYVRPTMEDPETRDFPGHFCTHGAHTPEDWDRFREFAQPFGRQLWMTETGGGRRDWRGAMASATAMHDAFARGNVSAWLFWQFTSLVRGHEPRVGYWPAKHFYRFIRPGAVRVEATSNDDSLLVTAYTHPESGKLTAVLINRADEEAAVSVAGAGAAGRWRLYVSDDQDKWAVRDAVGPSFTMPPHSIATLQSGEEDDLRSLALTDEVAGPEDLERRIKPIAESYWGDIGRGAELGQMDWVQRKLAEGQTVETRTYNGWTPLHYATLWYQKEMIDFLFEKGADVNAPAKDGWTPVHAAAACFLKDTDELLRSYIERGGDVNATTTDGWTVLHSAAVNCFTAWDYPPEWAANKVQIVLDAGADPNAPDANGRTPLHWAAWMGWTQGPLGPVSPEIVQMLIDGGATVDAQDKAGRTPLHYAAEEGYDRIVGALMAAAADPSVQDGVGRTATDLARVRQFDGIVALLSGEVTAAEPDGEDETEAPARKVEPGKLGNELRAAAAAGDVDAVEGLLAADADPDAAAPRSRRTALHAAAAAGHVEVVKALIAGGANVEAQDSDGFTPAQRARQLGHDEAVRLLEQAVK